MRSARSVEKSASRFRASTRGSAQSCACVIGPGLPFPIDAAVRLDHRNDFRRRAGEKTFVRDEDIVAGDVRLGNLDSEFRRDIEHDRARDAAQARRP